MKVLQGKGKIKGKLLGGCNESLYEIITGTRYADQKDICLKYNLFPSKEEWIDKILFMETCEEKPAPELYEKELMVLKEHGIFDVVKGIIVGKPQDEMYYEEYKQVILKVVNNPNLPILYNLNFGHAFPRTIIPYGIEAEIDLDNKTFTIIESAFSKLKNHTKDDFNIK